MPAVWVLALLGTILFFRLVLRCPSGLAPVAALCSTIVTIYVFGLAGQLRLGAWVCLTAGLLLLPATLYLRRGHLRCELLECATSVPLLGFVALAGWGFFRFRDVVFVTWDSFSHWGVAPLMFLRTGHFAAANGPMRFPDYPPGVSLLAYYVQQVCGYSEGFATWSVALLTLSGLLVLFEGLRVRQSLQLSVHLVFAAYFYTFFNWETVETVYADGTMMVLVTVAAFGCIWYLAHAARNTWFLLPVFIVLALAKPIAPLLAAFAALLGSACAVWRWIAASCGRAAFRQGAVLVALCAVLAITALGADRSWQWQLRRAGVAQGWVPPLTIAQVTEALGPAATHAQKQVTTNFKESLVFGPAVRMQHSEVPLNRLLSRLLGVTVLVVAPPSFVDVGLAVALMVLVVLIVEPAWRGRLAIAGLSLIGLGILAAYMVVLLALYLFRFSAYEASVLNSFQRYTYACAFPVAVSVAFAALRLLLRVPTATRALGALAFGLLLFVVAPPSSEQLRAFAHTPDSFRAEADFRRLIATQIAPVKPLIAPGSRVFVIYLGSNGWHYLIVRYELTPHRTNDDHWSVGKPMYQGDVWTADLQPADFARELSGYDYVLFPPTDPTALADYAGRYGELTPARKILKNRGAFQLFRVVRDADAPLGVRLLRATER